MQSMIKELTLKETMDTKLANKFLKSLFEELNIQIPEIEIKELFQISKNKISIELIQEVITQLLPSGKFYKTLILKKY